MESPITQHRNKVVVTYVFLAAPNTAISISCFSSFLEKHFMAHGIHPTHFSAIGEEWAPKIVSFSRIKKKYRSSNLEAIEALTIASMAYTGAEADAKLDFDIIGSCNRSKGMLIVAGTPQLIPSGISLAVACGECADLVYGYSLTSGRREGPLFTSMGISYGGKGFGAEAEYDSDLNMCWNESFLRQPHRSDRAKVFRSIYAWQLLNKQHLKLRIGGKTLLDWISEKAYRGNLQAVDNGLWTWTVSEEKVNEVRAEMHRAGLLKGWWPIGEPTPWED